MLFGKKNKKEMVINNNEVREEEVITHDDFPDDDCIVGTGHSADKVSLFTKSNVSTVKGKMLFSEMIDESQMDSIIKFLRQPRASRDYSVENTMKKKGAKWDLSDLDKTIITPVGIIIGENVPSNHQHVLETIQTMVTFMGSLQIGVNEIEVIQTFTEPEECKVKFFVGESGRLSFKVPKKYFSKK